MRAGRWAAWLLAALAARGALAAPWAAPPSATLIDASCAASSLRVRIAPAGAPADVEPTVQARRDACGGGGPSDPHALAFGNIRAVFDSASGLLVVSRVADGAVLLAVVAGSRAQAPRGEAD
jgi:hypothetical protein